MAKDNTISLDKNDPLINAEEEPKSSEEGSTYPLENHPTSQALMDMQDAGLTPEEAIEASKAETFGSNKNKQTKETNEASPTETLVRIAKFRWFVLLVLALASTATWAVEAQYMGRPYSILAWGLLGLTIILSLVTTKFLRLPTRAGLAALGWSASFFISALYGPPADIFHIPASLPWAGMLVLVSLWVAVAIWRKLGRYKIVDIILSIFLVYALLSPVWSLVDSYMMGQALALNFNVLSASPDMITSHLPWFLWPMSVMIAVILPLAALLALGDQISALRHKGKRHGGNLFLALAFILLIPYGFLSFNQAVTENPQWTNAIRSYFPEASSFVAALPPTDGTEVVGESVRAMRLIPTTPTTPGVTATETIIIVTDPKVAEPTGIETPAKPVKAMRLIPATPIEPAMNGSEAKIIIPEADLAVAPPEGVLATPLIPANPQGKTASPILGATAEDRLVATALELAEVKKQLEELEKKLESLTNSLTPPPTAEKKVRSTPAPNSKGAKAAPAPNKEVKAEPASRAEKKPYTF